MAESCDLAFENFLDEDGEDNYVDGDHYDAQFDEQAVCAKLTAPCGRKVSEAGSRRPDTSDRRDLSGSGGESTMFETASSVGSLRQHLEFDTSVTLAGWRSRVWLVTRVVAFMTASL